MATLPKTEFDPKHMAPTHAPILGKRLSLNLSESVYNEVAALAAERRSSMTEIVRLALGLVKIAIYENKLGHKLVVTTSTGEALKELVLPG